MSNGTLQPGDPPHFADYLYRATVLLKSMESEFIDAAAEAAPKGGGAAGAVPSTGTSTGGPTVNRRMQLRFEMSERGINDRLDALLRYGMFGDESGLAELLRLAEMVVRGAVEAAAAAGWYDDDEED